MHIPIYCGINYPSLIDPVVCLGGCPCLLLKWVTPKKAKVTAFYRAVSFANRGTSQMKRWALHCCCCCCCCSDLLPSSSSSSSSSWSFFAIFCRYYLLSISKNQTWPHWLPRSPRDVAVGLRRLRLRRYLGTRPREHVAQAESIFDICLFRGYCLLSC